MDNDDTVAFRRLIDKDSSTSFFIAIRTASTTGPTTRSSNYSPRTVSSTTDRIEVPVPDNDLCRSAQICFCRSLDL
jgi:hypothetical protein